MQQKIYIMSEYGRNNKQKHYIALNRNNNSAVIRLTRTAVCEFLGISMDTLRRRMKDNSAYHCEEYSVWCNCTIPLIKRGFRSK